MAELPVEVLGTLEWGRRLWRAENTGERPPVGQLAGDLPAGWWLSDELRAAVRHPEAASFDEVFVRAMRRRFSR